MTSAGTKDIRRPVVVRVMGTPFVECEGVAVALPSKALAMLAMLVIEPGPVSKDLIADRLWPDSAQARANLRKAIKAVRDRLGADALAVTSRTVAPGPVVGSDADAFGRALERFDAHHPDLDVACDACRDLLCATDEEWRGDLLDGQALEDNPIFDEWRGPHAERLREARGRLLAALVRAHAARRAWAAADRVAATALAHSPLDEAALRARMRVLAWSGRRAEALRLFDQVAATFEAELGVGPSERSVYVRDEIRDDTLSPAPPVIGGGARPPLPHAGDAQAPGADRGGSDDTASGPGNVRATRTAGLGGAVDGAVGASGGGRDDPGAPAPSPAPPPGLARLLAAIRAGDDPSDLPEDLLRGIARHRPTSLAGYRLASAARWLLPPERLGRRFVPLELVLTQRGPPSGALDPRRWDDLGTALAELDEAVIILLGRPGAGKTTLLRRLVLDLALRGAAGADGSGIGPETAPDRASVPVPLLAPLARFRPGASEAADSPAAWLERLWRGGAAGLPPLREIARDHGVLILLDGFDEMPDRPARDGRSPARMWRDFVRAELPDLPGARLVITCRETDFDIPLSAADAQVARLSLRPLSPAGMRAFVDAHMREEARDRFWGWLSSSRASSLYGTPYMLRLLTEQAIDGEPPADVAALLTAFVRSALVREVERDHPALAAAGALHERDVRQLVQDRWAGDYALPSRGRLIPGIEALALALLAGGRSGFEPGRTGDAPGGPDGAAFDRATIRAIIGKEAASAVISAGLGLGLLSEDVATDRLHFDHRLLLDYFAARRLAVESDPPPPVSPWREADLNVSLEAMVERLAAHEPVPPLPRTGFEDALSMAAIMSEDPAGAALALAESDLPLAGRTVASVPERFGPAIAARLRDRLLERTTAPEADVRARMAAGEALGELGDPRFERVEGEEGAYLLPPLCSIAGGRYPIGADADTGAADEAPAHVVELAGFAIGRFPVTNAEWACFMTAGGYDDPRFWDTPDAAAWREGRGTDEGPMASALEWTERFRADPGRLDELFEAGHMSSEWHAIFRRRVAMSAPELAVHLAEMYPGGRLMQPRYWDDPRFSSPAQPVVGISWFEARAYPAWLAYRTGRPFRLPSEAEWEAACGSWTTASGDAGSGGVFAFNTSETHLLRPTPIGIFGAAASGASDLLGNVWEWTSSLYGRIPGSPAFAYPYAADDGREDPRAPAGVRRVTRGGAWDSPRSVASPSVRDAVRPGGRDQAYGMRLACG